MKTLTTMKRREPMTKQERSVSVWHQQRLRARLRREVIRDAKWVGQFLSIDELNRLHLYMNNGLKESK